MSGTTLGDAFPAELKRLKDLAEQYYQIGTSGKFVLSWLNPLIEKAEQAQREQDAVAMLRLLQEMRDVR